MFGEFSSRGFAHLHTAGPLMVRSQVLPRDQAPDTLSNPCGSFRQDLRVIFKCSQSDPLHQRGVQRLLCLFIYCRDPVHLLLVRATPKINRRN